MVPKKERNATLRSKNGTDTPPGDNPNVWDVVGLSACGASAAPPISAVDCEHYAGPASFWRGMPLDAVVDLDPGIISFTDTHLEVSYGRDTCRTRAKRRVRKKWGGVLARTLRQPCGPDGLTAHATHEGMGCKRVAKLGGRPMCLFATFQRRTTLTGTSQV